MRAHATPFYSLAEPRAAEKRDGVAPRGQSFTASIEVLCNSSAVSFETDPEVIAIVITSELRQKRSQKV